MFHLLIGVSAFGQGFRIGPNGELSEQTLSDCRNLHILNLNPNSNGRKAGYKMWCERKSRLKRDNILLILDLIPSALTQGI